MVMFDTSAYFLLLRCLRSCHQSCWPRLARLGFGVGSVWCLSGFRKWMMNLECIHNIPPPLEKKSRGGWHFWFLFQFLFSFVEGGYPPISFHVFCSDQLLLWFMSLLWRGVQIFRWGVQKLFKSLCAICPTIRRQQKTHETQKRKGKIGNQKSQKHQPRSTRIQTLQNLPKP